MTNFSDRIILLNMAIYGKKQINIREDNKSAVVDILLQQEATMPQLAERLMLSHTALAKVMHELMQKNIVLCSEGKGTGSGRPPKVYEINADCAMTCAVILMQKSIDIYYVDMRGFQVNKRTAENDFSSLSALLADVQEYIGTLKEHPRLKDRVLKYIYIGLPTARFYGMDFCESCREVSLSFSERFPGIRNVVRRNVDYAMVAESKYGVLKNDCRNAVLLNLDEYLCASFLLNGSIYDGDRWMQGYDSAQNFPGLQALRAQAAGAVSAFLKEMPRSAPCWNGWAAYCALWISAGSFWAARRKCGGRNCCGWSAKSSAAAAGRNFRPWGGKSRRRCPARYGFRPIRRCRI